MGPVLVQSGLPAGTSEGGSVPLELPDFKHGLTGKGGPVGEDLIQSAQIRPSGHPWIGKQSPTSGGEAEKSGHAEMVTPELAGDPASRIPQREGIMPIELPEQSRAHVPRTGRITRCPTHKAPASGKPLPQLDIVEHFPVCDQPHFDSSSFA